MSSIKSEVEVLRIFDCFDDGTAGWKGKARVRDNLVVAIVLRKSSDGCKAMVVMLWSLCMRHTCYICNWTE